MRTTLLGLANALFDAEANFNDYDVGPRARWLFGTIGHYLYRCSEVADLGLLGAWLSWRQIAAQERAL